MHNAKYIKRAQENIVNNDLDEQKDEQLNQYYEQDELPSYNKSNRKMYEDMAYMSQAKQYLNQQQKKGNPYPKLKDFDETGQNEQNLKNEIEEMKKALEETKNQISNYKCSAAKEEMLLDNKVLEKPTLPKKKKDLLSSLLAAFKPTQCTYVDDHGQ